MKNISFRLTDSEHAIIVAAAAHAFLPVSAFLRKLALEYARDNKVSTAEVTVPVFVDTGELTELDFDNT